MPAPKRNRGWIWYFVALVVLTIAAITIMTWYNLQQQLRPEQFEAARKLWSEKGLADYTLVYSVKRNDESRVDQYRVTVQGGKAVASTFNGLEEARELLNYRGMEALFHDMEVFQELDEKKESPRVFRRAIFHPDHGGVLWYVRRVMGTRDRVEITVEKLEAAK